LNLINAKVLKLLGDGNIVFPDIGSEAVHPVFALIIRYLMSDGVFPLQQVSPGTVGYPVPDGVLVVLIVI
jgi:hypothetical protein